jgi:hypothetical protein
VNPQRLHSQAELDRRDAWGQMQDDLKNLSTRSRRIIATNSSHYVVLDRPDLIQKEVPVFIEQIRGRLRNPQPTAQRRQSRSDAPRAEKQRRLQR